MNSSQSIQLLQDNIALVIKGKARVIEMAVVCLDLGEVYWKLGLLDRLRQCLAEAVPIFRSLRVSREVLACLLRLQQAAEPESPSES